jgi:hypothetical protein
MAFLFGRKRNDKPEYTALQLQTSTSILAIPICWGTNRVAPNVIFYNNFQANIVKGGKGGKGGGGDHTIDYSADLVLALCEGPIQSTSRVWKDRLIFGTFGDIILIWDQTNNATDPMFVFYGTSDQTTWGYFAYLYPSYPLAFPSTAYIAAANFGLGPSATIGLFNVEVHGIFAGTATNGQDADPALVFQDFLISQQYGAQFDPTLIDYTTLLSAGGNGATLQDYCRAQGIGMSPLLVDQEQGSSILQRWLQICNTAAVWSGQLLRFVPYGDQSIAAGQIYTASITEAVPNNPDNIPGGFGFGFIDVASAGQFVADLGVKYATQYYSLTLQYVGATIPPGPGFYGRIGTTYYFSQYDIGVGVTITFQYTTSGGYVPNLQPLYSLVDDDFIDPGGDADPLVIERVDPYSLPTIQRIEVSSRSNNYAVIPVEARDQAQIEVFGPRVGTSISAREICDEIVVGPKVAQAILQRGLYVRSKYKFTTDWSFCLIDPMDIIALNDSVLGLVNYPVRVTSIEEDDKGMLAFECEELVYGVSTPPLYNTATISSPIVNRAQKVGPVNSPPLIYEPPAGFTGGVAKIMLGASGALPTGAVDPMWGGAAIYASVDNVTYAQIGQLTGADPQGFLTATLAAGSGWDTTNTLSVDLTESGGVLSSTSLATAQAGAMLCLVGGELLSFENATLTAPNKYNLTGLQRGMYGTLGVSHASGTNFDFLSSAAILTMDIPSQWIGQSVYLKFQSFNIFLQGGQDLANCVAYLFAPGQAAYGHPIADQLSSGLPLDLGSVLNQPTITDDFGSVVQPAPGTVDLGSVLAYDPITQQLQAALPSGSVDFGAVTAAVTVFGDFGPVTAPPTVYIDLRVGSTP